MAKKRETTKKVEPIVLDCGKALKGKTFKGDTFEIIKTNKGVCYHVFGGYSIFVTPNNIALYQTLNELIENCEQYNNLQGEEREQFDLNLSAIAYVLDVPLFAFSSADFTFDIASKVVQFLQETYDNAMNKPLQEETPEEDNQFKEFALAVEDVQKELNKQD